jgi:hypothetical protein
MYAFDHCSIVVITGANAKQKHNKLVYNGTDQVGRADGSYKQTATTR